MALLTATKEEGKATASSGNNGEVPTKKAKVSRSDAMKLAWVKRRAREAAEKKVEAAKGRSRLVHSSARQNPPKTAAIPTTAEKVVAAEALLEIMGDDANAASELLGWVLKLRLQSVSPIEKPF